jgi:hypothetical protein
VLLLTLLLLPLLMMMKLLLLLLHHLGACAATHILGLSLLLLQRVLGVSHDLGLRLRDSAVVDTQRLVQSSVTTASLVEGREETIQLLRLRVRTPHFHRSSVFQVLHKYSVVPAREEHVGPAVAIHAQTTASDAHLLKLSIHFVLQALCSSHFITDFLFL